MLAAANLNRLASTTPLDGIFAAPLADKAGAANGSLDTR